MMLTKKLYKREENITLKTEYDNGNNKKGAISSQKNINNIRVS